MWYILQNIIHMIPSREDSIHLIGGWYIPHHISHHIINEYHMGDSEMSHRVV